MNVLFIHQNLPGQFRHLIRYFLSSPENNVVGICQPQAPGIQDAFFKRVVKGVYKPHRKPAKGTHPYMVKVEEAVLNGQGAARTLLGLKEKGFRPDLVFAHIGWGETLYFKDIYPDVPLIGYCEFYYHGEGVDLDFDPEFPGTIDTRLRVRSWNMIQLSSLVSADTFVSPTEWQKSLYPKELRHKISVIHEGVDTDIVKPESSQRLVLPDGTVLTKDMEVVTYTARGLEPYRGFHVFMRAVGEICRRRPNCHIVITGGDGVHYGKRLPDGLSYREKMLKEVSIDPRRVHFMGYVPYNTHLEILKVSSAHIYLTIPFVLSWSMMEAMAAGCVIVGSSTPPVEEMIDDRRNGILVDFFSPGEIADRIDEILDDPNRMVYFGQAARNDIVEKYNANDKLAEYKTLWESLLK